MKYPNIRPAEFISRSNRFVAQVLLDGKPETVHVKNTGRCRELLLPGTLVYLTESSNIARKLRCDLVAVEKHRKGKEPLLINMDSQAPNTAASEWIKTSGIFSENAEVRREVTFGSSRFDLFVSDGDRKAFIEVKGVTLEHDGIASFPDAPTERGVKHVGELARCLDAGYEAYILFVIQMKEITLFRPNDATHKDFGDALRSAADLGVGILAYDCTVTPDSMVIDKKVPVDLSFAGIG
ncbi:MAG: DNA/RNA nuclease SfsA [Clostridia bacterium]|nr:DNA/RNA nuclease SfsA [Clostridia bacterium]